MGRVSGAWWRQRVWQQSLWPGAHRPKAARVAARRHTKEALVPSSGAAELHNVDGGRTEAAVAVVGRELDKVRG
jgi:hypothetical protein